MALAPVRSRPGDLSDDDLLGLVAEGDDAAFAAFYDHTAPRVLGLVTRVLRDPAQSEEVTQEVYLEAWQRATRFDPARGRAASWLLTMAHRRAVDRVRSAKASRDRDLTVGARTFDGVRDDVADTAAVSIEYGQVTTMMATLSPAHRQALELTYLSGLTNVEAAGAAGVPVGTMKTRIRDALIQLRRELPTASAA